jgi:hypothetical protein
LYLLVYLFCIITRRETTKQLVSSVYFDKAHNREEITSYAPSSGFLQDGRKYMEYRVNIYTDDFKADVSRKGRYGGCYLLPIGIKPEERAGFASVRCITLAPSNVSTNEVLMHITPDIVKCTMTGVEGMNAYGASVTVFLDIMRYIGDYPAVTHALNVLGYNSRALCHLCAFLRQDRTRTEGLNYYGYSTSVHSRASSFCRDGKRIKNVRRGLLYSSLLQTLCLKSKVDEIRCPMHTLSEALSKVRGQVPLTDSGVPVLP